MKSQNIPRQFKEIDLNIENTDEITTGNYFVFSLDDRFKPYDKLVLTNLNADNDAEIEINGGIIYDLPKGTTTNINNKISEMRIKNNGSGTINTAEIKGVITQYSKKADFFNNAVGTANILTMLGTFLKR